MQLLDDELAKLRQHNNPQGPHDPAAAWQLIQHQASGGLSLAGILYAWSQQQPQPERLGTRQEGQE